LGYRGFLSNSKKVSDDSGQIYIFLEDLQGKLNFQILAGNRIAKT
jgi:hypothetical protein